MQRRLCLSALLGLTAVAGAQAPAGRPFTLGRTYQLASRALGTTLSYQVYLPPSYEDAEYAPRRYPIIYVLDSPGAYRLVTGVVDYQITSAALPEVIVVGISATSPERDYTPTHSLIGADGKEASDLRESGGAAAFAQYLREELIPRVERQVRGTGHRTLVGHSLAGLFAYHMLLTTPDLFRNYLFVDPSLWWDRREIGRRAQAGLSPPIDGGVRQIYHATADEPPSSLFDPTEHNAANRELTALLEARRSPNLRVLVQHFPGERHGPVAVPAIHAGLSWFFRGGAPPFELYLDAARLSAFHRAAQADLGLEGLPAERDVAIMAPYIMAMPGRRAEAEALLRLNAANYPHSARAHVQLADFLLSAADTVGARTALSAALRAVPHHRPAAARLARLAPSGRRAAPQKQGR